MRFLCPSFWLALHMEKMFHLLCNFISFQAFRILSWKMVSTTGSVLICNIQEVGYESIPDKLWYVNEAFYWCYVYCCVLRFPSYPVHAKYMPTATSLTVFSDHIRFSMHGLNRQIMLQALHDMLQVIHNMLQIINNTSTLRYYNITNTSLFF